MMTATIQTDDGAICQHFGRTDTDLRISCDDAYVEYASLAELQQCEIFIALIGEMIDLWLEDRVATLMSPLMHLTRARFVHGDEYWGIPEEDLARERA